MSVAYRDIEALFEGTGLVVRGGCHTLDSDDIAGHTVVMIGNVGPAMWAHFAAERPDCPDPLDTWTKSVVAPRAERLGADVVYPNDRPYRPFQQWAMRAEPVKPSPLGILIHPGFRALACLPGRPVVSWRRRGGSRTFHTAETLR